MVRIMGSPLGERAEGRGFARGVGFGNGGLGDRGGLGRILRSSSARVRVGRGLGWWALLLAALGSGMGLGGCASRRYEPAGVFDPFQPREMAKTLLAPHVLEPGDQVSIAVRPSRFSPTTSLLTVQPDGTIDLDFWGDVSVAGLTLSEAEERARAAIEARERARGALGEDGGGIEVAMRLQGDGSRAYYVLGTVRNEGRVPYTGNPTVLDAILNAGLLSYSLPNEAYLARPGPNGSPDRILAIDWDAIARGETLTNYQVLPGDRIVVPGGKPPGLLKTLLGGP